MSKEERRNELIEPTGSVSLDGSKEFEIVVTESSMMRMSIRENKELVQQYEDFKNEAISKGYTVEEHQRPDTREHIAKFTPPNSKMDNGE